MIIRTTTGDDRDVIYSVHQQAFGGLEEAQLTLDLIGDPSAQPVLSLLAEFDGRPVGHVLFTRVRIEPGDGVAAAILCPLAVVPEVQSQGIGSALVNDGLKQLTETGTGLVFVLGHPDYYPRFGFRPAGVHGLEATYPIAEKNAAAWMVRDLREGVLNNIRGRVVCADVLDKPEYWIE